jgi:hypothetical protein
MALRLFLHCNLLSEAYLGIFVACPGPVVLKCEEMIGLEAQ